MRGIHCRTLTVAALLGIGVLGAMAPANAGPHHRGREQRGSKAADFRQFTGRALATNSSGSLMQVRADDGKTYTVRTTAYIKANQRVRVSGHLRNGIIEKATVGRI